MHLFSTANILLAIAIILLYLISRRRFKRRGLGGLQHFSSYERGVLTTFIEWLLKWAARLTIIGVMIYYLLHRY